MVINREVPSYVARDSNLINAEEISQKRFNYAAKRYSGAFSPFIVMVMIYSIASVCCQNRSAPKTALTRRVSVQMPKQILGITSSHLYCIFYTTGSISKSLRTKAGQDVILVELQGIEPWSKHRIQ